ncbi:MAG: hypothetical protein GY811_09085 [Myxococcales bacterium]|nr:hypothetical protein [Myxococcales bacterium]
MSKSQFSNQEIAFLDEGNTLTDSCAPVEDLSDLDEEAGNKSDTWASRALADDTCSLLGAAAISGRLVPSMRLFLLSLVPMLAVACSPTPPKEESRPVHHETEVATGPTLDTPIKRDLDRICNAEEQSGALHEIPSARASHVGIWLGTNLESQEARTLSATLVQLVPTERIAKLRSVLDTHGFEGCEILATW